MTLVDDYHAARKARLERMGAPPRYQLPVVVAPRPSVPPQLIDAGWEGMWFYDLLQELKEPRLTVPVREIQEVVCKYYKVSILDLISQRRGRSIAMPRQVAMYFCRILTAHSYAELGRRFGGRDHSTVLYGSQKVQDSLGYDMRVTCDVNALRKLLA